MQNGIGAVFLGSRYFRRYYVYKQLRYILYIAFYWKFQTEGSYSISGRQQFNLDSVKIYASKQIKISNYLRQMHY